MIEQNTDAQQRHMRISTWLIEQPSFAHLLFSALLFDLPFPLLLALLLRSLSAALLHKAVEQHLAVTQALLNFDHFQFQSWPNLHARVATVTIRITCLHSHLVCGTCCHIRLLSRTFHPKSVQHAALCCHMLCCHMLCCAMLCRVVSL